MLWYYLNCWNHFRFERDMDVPVTDAREKSGKGFPPSSRKGRPGGGRSWVAGVSRRDSIHPAASAKDSVDDERPSGATRFRTRNPCGKALARGARVPSTEPVAPKRP